MAVAFLKYEAGGDVQTTRDSAFICNGPAPKFHEWDFRSYVKLDAKENLDDKPEVVANIVETLRNEAAAIACHGHWKGQVDGSQRWLEDHGRRGPERRCSRKLVLKPKIRAMYRQAVQASQFQANHQFSAS